MTTAAAAEEANLTCERFQLEFLPAVYGVEFAVALLGNVAALWLLVARGRRGEWHSGTVLSCNLALGDLLYALTLPLLIVYYARRKHWSFGAAACVAERFLFTCNLYASIFFIMAIGVNRAVALAFPFFVRSHLRPAHAGLASAGAWLLVALLSSPVLAMASLCPGAAPANGTLCVSYCEATRGPPRPLLTYLWWSSGVGCLLPFLLTLASYGVVLRAVWRNAGVTARERRKVALLVAAVLLLYAVSFVPYHVLRLLLLELRVSRPHVSSCWLYSAYQISKGLATLNPCLHPLLYAALIDSIADACCCRRRQRQHQEQHAAHQLGPINPHSLKSPLE